MSGSNPEDWTNPPFAVAVAHPVDREEETGQATMAVQEILPAVHPHDDDPTNETFDPLSQLCRQVDDFKRIADTQSEIKQRIVSQDLNSADTAGNAASTELESNSISQSRNFLSPSWLYPTNIINNNNQDSSRVRMKIKMLMCAILYVLVSTTIAALAIVRQRGNEPEEEDTTGVLFDETRTNASTSKPTLASTANDVSEDEIECYCPDSCTPKVLGSYAIDGYTCKQKILVAMSELGLTEKYACSVIAEQFNYPCGPCDPNVCLPTQAPTGLPTTSIPTSVPTNTPSSAPSGSPTTSIPTNVPTNAPSSSPSEPRPPCGCSSCMDDVLNTVADDASCGDWIEFLQTVFGRSEIEACRAVGETFLFQCGLCYPGVCSVCGCSTCTNEVLELDADGIRCGVVIEFLQTQDGGGLSALEACTFVATEYTNCAPCLPCL